MIKSFPNDVRDSTEDVGQTKEKPMSICEMIPINRPRNAEHNITKVKSIVVCPLLHLDLQLARVLFEFAACVETPLNDEGEVHWRKTGTS